MHFFYIIYTKFKTTHSNYEIKFNSRHQRYLRGQRFHNFADEKKNASLQWLPIPTRSPSKRIINISYLNSKVNCTVAVSLAALITIYNR